MSSSLSRNGNGWERFVCFSSGLNLRIAHLTQMWFNSWAWIISYVRLLIKEGGGWKSIKLSRGYHLWWGVKEKENNTDVHTRGSDRRNAIVHQYWVQQGWLDNNQITDRVRLNDLEAIMIKIIQKVPECKRRWNRAMNALFWSTFVRMFNLSHFRVTP
jgi:hypothetical protein